MRMMMRRRRRRMRMRMRTKMTPATTGDKIDDPPAIVVRTGPGPQHLADVDDDRSVDEGAIEEYRP
jgi:hypothetical protein